MAAYRPQYTGLATQRRIAVSTHLFKVRLTGDAARGSRLDAAALARLLDVLVQGARGALRLRLEGRSRARGSSPRWLESAARFDCLGLSAGSTVVQLEARSLAEAAPAELAQGQLFSSLDRGASALHLWVESAGDALAGDEDSELYDEAFLDGLRGLGGVLGAGLREIALWTAGAPTPLVVDAPRLDRVASLIRETPPAQRVRLAGRLDTIRHSDRMFVLVLAEGGSVKGIAEDPVQPETLARFFGRDVVVDGMAVFRPSGAPLRVEADSLEPARAQDLAIFGSRPEAASKLDRRALERPQGPRTGINAILGRWPGDETDEEIASLLAEIS